MWESVPSTTALTWDAAKTYCANLSLGTYTDWRLPNIQELSSIVDYAKSDGANYWYASKFTLAANNYWSSTTRADSTTDARTLVFSNAGTSVNAKASNYRVICTR